MLIRQSQGLSDHESDKIMQPNFSTLLFVIRLLQKPATHVFRNAIVLARGSRDVLQRSPSVRGWKKTSHCRAICVCVCVFALVLAVRGPVSGYVLLF